MQRLFTVWAAIALYSLPAIAKTLSSDELAYQSPP